MMRREVKGVLSAQQLVVFVVCVLLNVISTIVIIVYNLCRKRDRQTMGGKLIISIFEKSEGLGQILSVLSIIQHVEVNIVQCVCVQFLTGAGPSLLNQPGLSQPCLSWNTQPCSVST